MQTYISILRGINVSGHNLIKMDVLRNLCEKIGFNSVKTYIQSGNIVFKSTETDSTKLALLLAEAIRVKFSFEVPVMIKSLSYLKTVLVNNPYQQLDLTKLHFTFLSNEPEKTIIQQIDKTTYAPDNFEVVADCVYLFCPNGYGNTKLNNNFFEKKFKCVATTRNLNTVNQLILMAGEL